jgi:dihydrofolate reductase
MIISLIVAMDHRRGIGKDNQLPWRLPADLKRFRELTMGHNLIVGRKTYESIGRPLPGRTMIIVTRNKTYQAEGCIIVHSLTDALALARAKDETEAFIGGGAELYTQSLNLADRLYLTRIDTEVDADTFFPAWNEQDWTLLEEHKHPADEKHLSPFTFQTLQRKTA